MDPCSIERVRDTPSPPSTDAPNTVRIEAGAPVGSLSAGIGAKKGVAVLQVLGFFLVVWVVLMIVGVVIKSLFWLAIVGAVLFLATAAYGWVKRQALRR